MSELSKRRLAAIVAADVAGYSRLVGIDEEATLGALRAARHEVIDPLLAGHGGRVANTAGDSLLMEFPSVVDATRFAVAMQSSLAERAAGVPEDGRMLFRLGLHLGDVVADADDMLGDGVNIAARLQALAEPGGIAISDDAHRQVRDRLRIAWADDGEHEVKNIARPVRVWRWSCAEIRECASDAPAVSEKPSIAVLAFDNMSTDPAHDCFADGIAEDIITALSKISRLRVIARNSSFAYRGRAVDLRRVAGELAVRYVLEGSVRSGGNRLRITAQLIDAQDGSHIWAERFDRTVEDIFDIQDEITKEVVTALRVRLTDGEEAHVMSRGTNDVEAWQHCVRATELFLRFNATDYSEARRLAERATERDPSYAYAWATLGFTWWWDGRLGFTGDSAAKFARAGEYTRRAMELDDKVAWCIGLSVMTAASLGRPDEGVATARRGVELHPGSADARAFLAFSLTHDGQYAESVEHYRAAMLLNPLYPNWYRNGLARTLIALDRFGEALPLVDEILQRDPTFIQAWLYRAYALGQIARAEEAAIAVSQIANIAPNLRLAHIRSVLVLKEDRFAERLIQVLRAVGMRE